MTVQAFDPAGRPWTPGKDMIDAMVAKVGKPIKKEVRLTSQSGCSHTILCDHVEIKGDFVVLYKKKAAPQNLLGAPNSGREVAASFFRPMSMFVFDAKEMPSSIDDAANLPDDSPLLWKNRDAKEA